jgi:hypothetical protein
MSKRYTDLSRVGRPVMPFCHLASLFLTHPMAASSSRSSCSSLLFQGATSDLADRERRNRRKRTFPIPRIFGFGEKKTYANDRTAMRCCRKTSYGVQSQTRNDTLKKSDRLYKQFCRECRSGSAAVTQRDRKPRCPTRCPRENDLSNMPKIKLSLRKSYSYLL